jgi:hypothetical protein
MMFMRNVAAFVKSLATFDLQTRDQRLSEIRIIDGWQSAPFGTSKMTVAKNARMSRKRKAKKRARRLGHA